MTPQIVAESLEEIAINSNLTYIRCNPEVPDFTVEQPFEILISGSKKRISIEVVPSDIRIVMGMLEDTIFQKEKMVLAWNIKPFFTYLTHFFGKTVIPPSGILDLKVIENFLGFFGQKAPENLGEAVHRSRRVGNYKSWKTIYNKLHLPLLLKTLPRLESSGLHHKTDRTSKFAYYEIEGQRNGRLRCFGKYKRSYVPHTLGNDQKNVLRPKSFDDFFMLADINNCEVTVLQYLSGDSKLKEFLDSNRDVYEQIYELLTGDGDVTESKRKMCKLIFLPVIYGCGARGLSANIGINESTGRDLIRRVHHYFKDAVEWITELEKQAKTRGKVEDYFGRPREFDGDNYYTSRNFVVQSPAATICLEKLVQIDDVLDGTGSKVVFTVHDGYGITTNTQHAKETWLAVKDSVRSESILCPGLRLDFHAQFGKKLNDLRTLWK